MSKSSNTSGARGIAYEARLSMLCFLRGFTRGLRNYRLEYQVKEADKFDDIVFDEGGERFQVMQLKHKESKTKITHLQLFHENFNTDYNLLKYVKAVKDINCNVRFKDKINIAVVITNIDFDLRNGQLNLITNKPAWYGGLNSIQLQETTLDDCAIFDCLNLSPSAKYYTFADNNEIVQILMKQKEVLVKKILDESKKVKRQPTILRSMVNQSQEQTLKKQNQALAEALDILSENEIRDALKYIVYAVGQPNDEKLEEIIKNELKHQFKLQKVDDIYNNLEVTMRNWCDRKTGQFSNTITFRDAKKFFQMDFKRIVFDVRYPIESFTGRVEELQLIREKFNEEDINVSHTVAIIGLGGIGKTELAKEFIKEFESDFFGKIIWIEAQDDKSVEISFRRLEEKLKLQQDTNKKDVKTIIEEVFDYFEGLKVLFVFDNFDVNSKSNSKNYVTYCRRYVSQPNKKSRPYFLFTSIDKKCMKNVSVIDLNVFSKQEAVKLIENEFTKVNYAQEQKYVEELAKILQYFPLALQQAIAYIKEQHASKRVIGKTYDVQNYLKEFDTKTKVLLEHESDPDIFEAYEKTTFITWNVTFGAINNNRNGKNAIKVLQSLAYLYADEIDPKFFVPLFDDESCAGQSFELLERYCLIKKIDGTDFYQIHRLVQAVVRVKFHSIQKEILEETLQLINPKALEYYNSVGFVFNKLFCSCRRDRSYLQYVDNWSHNQTMHMNSLYVYIKDTKDLYDIYGKLFVDINDRGFINAAFKDDIDKMKACNKSKEDFERLIKANFEELIRRECNKVIKYATENEILKLNGKNRKNEKQLLFFAAKYENFKILQFFLENGMNANLRSETDYSLLTRFQESIKIFCLFLPKTRYDIHMKYDRHLILSNTFLEGFVDATKINPEDETETMDIDIASADGFTLIHILCTSSHSCADQVKVLVENGANVNLKNSDGKIPLYYAVKHNKVDIIMYLRDISLIDENTVLEAIKNNQLSIIKGFFLKERSIDKNIKARHYKKAFNYASIYKMFDIFKYILSRTKVVDEDILLVTIKRDQLSLVRALCSKHFRTDHQFSNDRTLIEVAVEHFSLNIILFFKNEFVQLCSQGRGANSINEAGETLLIRYVKYLYTLENENEFLNNIKFLVENGVNVDIEDNDGKTALHYAIGLKSVVVSLYLLTKVSSVDEQILIQAMVKEDLGILGALLQKHFTVHHRFSNGKTILDIAKERKQEGIIRLIECLS